MRCGQCRAPVMLISHVHHPHAMTFIDVKDRGIQGDVVLVEIDDITYWRHLSTAERVVEGTERFVEHERVCPARLNRRV